MQYIGFDFETYLIDSAQSPKPVCFSWWGALDWDVPLGVILAKDAEKYIYKMLKDAVDGKAYLIAQNASFDLGVIFTHYPKMKPLLFKALELGRVRDTKIREQLYNLSVSGRVDGISCSLEALAKKYLRLDLSAVKHSEDAWRLRYSELDGVPIKIWPKAAYDYALQDSEYAVKIFKLQDAMKRARGYGSMNTEELQVKSEFCLQIITQRGLRIDQNAIKNARYNVEKALKPIREFLIDEGYATVDLETNKLKKNSNKFRRYIADTFPGQITFSDKNIQKFCKKFEIENRYEALQEFLAGNMSEVCKKAFYGTVATGRDILEELPKTEVIQSWLDYMELEKALTTYIPRMEKAEYVYCPYRNLKATGRTSSYVSEMFPSLNIQQIPRAGGLRECFIPRGGYKFATIDYASIELVCVGHVMKSLFGKSRMFDLVNTPSGPIDLHAYVGSALYAMELGIGMDFDSFRALKKDDPKTYKEYRNRGKPIGLGYFGGLGEDTMCKVSRGQGIPMTLEQAEIGRRVHSKIFPEIIDYLGWRAKRDGYEHPRATEKGWVHTQKFRDSEHGFGYESNGRYRACCTFCSCANGKAMQSIAADGLKEAIFICVRACEDPSFMNGEFNDCFVVFEIHDELGFELPEYKARERLKVFMQFMVDGMQKVLYNMRVRVEGGIMSRWTKDDSNHEYSEEFWKNAS